MRRELKSSATDEPFVAVLQAKRLQPLPNSQKKSKKVGNQLDFPLTRCKLMFGNGLRPIGNNFQAHFIRISAKDDENQPSLKLLFCSRKRNTPAKYHCVFVSCWAFLCRFWSRFLAGPSSSRMGKRPAFFCAQMSGF